MTCREQSSFGLSIIVEWNNFSPQAARERCSDMALCLGDTSRLSKVHGKLSSAKAGVRPVADSNMKALSGCELACRPPSAGLGWSRAAR